ncbi:hypothetical protein BCR33DRAFT_736268 [Rhizoclosmatium globosum]|uniref:N-acetyltransferase domain-containing protein n=1 Tax=Rhizoclosmatium globosum TaxID=329046 RepID=A0A1Y2CKC8_9FUNG|nr:hypothetical protein BCR33DRAFT_736268 [Rhizoclosmatium globosum]|eukprot:ORY47471.1 hypothetical protein BCR33DRAFT_736268 [Rhizoclosmatium globosum]
MPLEFVTNVNQSRRESLLQQWSQTHDSKHTIPSIYVVAVTSENQVVGYCELGPNPEPSETQYPISLETIHVAKKYQGCGISKSLIVEAVRLMLSLSDMTGGVVVKAFQQNQRAISFYKKVGAEWLWDFETSEYGGQSRQAVALGWKSMKDIISK